VDLYEDLGCGAAGTLWPRAGGPGPTWQYLGTLTLDAAPPSLDVSIVAQVQGDAPPLPGPPAGPVPLPLETAKYARGGPPPSKSGPAPDASASGLASERRCAGLGRRAVTPQGARRRALQAVRLGWTMRRAPTVPTDSFSRSPRLCKLAE